ncbi:MAG: Fe-S cluster assembly protein NifU [Kiritimatiellae bacterium]|nr:Fe-S cluster assembly protein NifU [Kiritimatiellia bacterium]
MWDYTGKVLEHFRNPRNVGLIKDPDGVGEVGSLACGDALKLSFKLDDEKKCILDAKFQTFGCASAIASSSALTEIIKGMTLEEAGQVTNQDIAEYLGGLPEQKMHCSVMGREALEVAIENYHTGDTSKKILSGKVICTCFGVTEEEIEHVVRDNDLTTVDQVTNYCKAGGGCGHCKVDISDVITKVQREKEKTAPEKPVGKKLTVLQKIRLIEETLEREIRPMLQKDGGDIELIDLDGSRVIVAMRGMCAHCSLSEVTTKEVVEKKLREFVADDLMVEEEK